MTEANRCYKEWTVNWKELRNKQPWICFQFVYVLLFGESERSRMESIDIFSSDSRLRAWVSAKQDNCQSLDHRFRIFAFYFSKRKFEAEMEVNLRHSHSLLHSPHFQTLKNVILNNFFFIFVESECLICSVPEKSFIGHMKLLDVCVTVHHFSKTM